MTKRRFTPTHPYSIALLGVVVVFSVAWVGRDARRIPVPGMLAPSFEAVTLDGEAVRLEDYRGKVILLNVWATWCPPCREEMPSMEALYKYFQERGEDFTVLAVSVDAPFGEADVNGQVGGNLRAFAEEFELTFPILHDPAGDIQRIYYTTGVPESFLIDRDGMITRRLAGATDWNAQENRQAIERMLERPPKTP